MRVPHDPELPVYTGWDLGIDDATAVWFAQIAGLEIRIIDHLEVQGRSLIDIARVVLAKPYTYAEHYLPHDVDTRELSTARTRKESLESVGLRPIRAGSRLPVADGINAVRTMFPKCVFDEGKTESGLEALRAYRVEIDENKDTPKAKPLHDWASHSADAFRELAVQILDVEAWNQRVPIVDNDYDPMSYGIPEPQIIGVEGGQEWTPW